MEGKWEKLEKFGRFEKEVKCEMWREGRREERREGGEENGKVTMDGRVRWEEKRKEED